MPQAHLRRRRLGPALGLLVLLGLLIGSPGVVQALSVTDVVASATASPRVFYPNGDGVRDTTSLTYRLAATASVSVAILDYKGSIVRTLRGASTLAAGTYKVTWNGKTSTGSMVRNAGYRFRIKATRSGATFLVDRWVTKARSQIYPWAPGVITVAIDPGHGGPDPGAVRPGLYEKTANLTIALRLRAMLLGAGVNVVMTRTTDTKVNRSGTDWTGDGVVAYRDELASRIEVANRARADVFMVLHNNGTPPGVGGTETWYDNTRSFTSQNRLFATLVQTQMLTSLRRIDNTTAWSPIDRGVLHTPFYVLRSYAASFCPRPSLMPGILGESLAMGSSYERYLLKSAIGTQAIAEGYYEGLARFLAQRAWGAGYTLLDAPATTLQEGAASSATVRVTNRSPRTWAAGSVALTLSSVAAVPYYDGSNDAGNLLKSVPLGIALAPGQSVDVSVPFKAPAYSLYSATAGRTLLKFDLVAGSTRLASYGVAPLQIPLQVTGDPNAPPSPSPSATPSPSPSASPAAHAPAAASPSPNSPAAASPSPNSPAGSSPSPDAAPSASPSPDSSPSASPSPDSPADASPATDAPAEASPSS
jgi:N-acetylmuramoyl-L-alanine amidase